MNLLHLFYVWWRCYWKKDLYFVDKKYYEVIACSSNDESRKYRSYLHGHDDDDVFINHLISPQNNNMDCRNELMQAEKENRIVMRQKDVTPCQYPYTFENESKLYVEVTKTLNGVRWKTPNEMLWMFRESNRSDSLGKQFNIQVLMRQVLMDAPRLGWGRVPDKNYIYTLFAVDVENNNLNVTTCFIKFFI